MTGTFSNWGNQQADTWDGLEKLLAARDLPKATPPIRIVTVPSLATGRVYQERERFSGGVNLSACARNAARREEALKRDLTCYVDKEIGNVYCAPAAAAEIRRRFPELEHGAPNVRPFKLLPMSFEDLNAPTPDLSWAAIHRAYGSIQREADRAISRSIMAQRIKTW